MPRGPRRGEPTGARRDGPVRPGSPLYRLLELIAREIAKDAAENRPARSPEEVPKKT
jgi:hypothetical protein